MFSALSWSCSSKSLHVTRESVDPSDPSRPGAHFVTLEKLYVEEQKLYRHLKVYNPTKSVDFNISRYIYEEQDQPYVRFNLF